LGVDAPDPIARRGSASIAGSAAPEISFDTPKLPTVKTFYFVVRARDQADNEDPNTIEREGQNLCV